MEDRQKGVRLPAVTRAFPYFHNLQVGSGSNLAFLAGRLSVA